MNGDNSHTGIAMLVRMRSGMIEGQLQRVEAAPG
jgi:hypothetical protein